jgi:hypothetical protein
VSTGAEVSKVGKAAVVVSRRGRQMLILKLLYPTHPIAEVKKIATGYSQTVFLIIYPKNWTDK